MDSDAIESAVLRAVESEDIADTWAWAPSVGIVDHNAVMGIVNSLTADGYVVTQPVSAEFWELTAEAAGYVKSGSPEAQVFAALPETAEGADEATLKAALGDDLVKIGLGKAMARKWVSRDKASGRYSRSVSVMGADELVDQLRRVASGGADADAALLKELKKRQLIALV
jgi:hypothetical protein